MTRWGLYFRMVTTCVLLDVGIEGLVQIPYLVIGAIAI
jgi:hypothetical protein